MPHTYGPVPSRRFGLSLGIDLIPHKVCSYGCVYCQLGKTTDLTAVARDFAPVDEIVEEVAAALTRGPRPEVLTLAGSGEPTLYRDLELLNHRLRARFQIPLLLITNGATLWQPEVARAALATDILAPSLDAGDARTWRKIDQPAAGVTFEQMVEGLRAVTHAHTGEVRVEVMLVHKVNDSEESLQAIAGVLQTLRCDRIDINTPVRPPGHSRPLTADEGALARALELFGSKAAPIGHFEPRAVTAEIEGDAELVADTLFRRPCTAADLAASLSMNPHQVLKLLDLLEVEGRVRRKQVGAEVWWQAGA
ncbi:MAG: radical SAM protein [Deltaproteobacteria bacterium]|nr:radical SAM protein [Deltaproteobacteria bacterium]